MKYNYRNIIRSVAVNIGINSPNSMEVSIIKKDIYDVSMKVFRHSKPIKENLSEDITTNAQELMLPENFFSADEVAFKDQNGQRYYTKELLEEEYLRWDPGYNVNETNFETVAINGEAQTIFNTVENLEFDGYVGYYFSDSESMSILKWKPAINGTVYMLYSVVPEDDIVNMDSEPKMHRAFRELLVLGASIKGLLRKDVKTDIELANKTLKLRMWQDEFKQSSAEIAGYVNRTTSTPLVKPMDFMNFYEDIIFG